MPPLSGISEHNVGSSQPLIWGSRKPDFLLGLTAWDAHGPNGEGQKADGTPWGSFPTTIYKAAAVRGILSLPTTNRAPQSIQ